MKLLSCVLFIFIFSSAKADLLEISITPFQDSIKNWQNWDYLEDNTPGVSSYLAHKYFRNFELNTVTVAVIDTGVDIFHEDLRENIWKNIDEIPNNGIDDDNNGYIDDFMGWNFLGDAKAQAKFYLEDIQRDIYKMTANENEIFISYEKESDVVELIDLKKKSQLSKDEVTRKKNLEASINQRINKAQFLISEYENDLKIFLLAKKFLVQTLNIEVTLSKLNELKSNDKSVIEAAKICKEFIILHGNEENVRTEIEYYTNKLLYSYNQFFEVKHITGETENFLEKGYGNNNVIGKNSDHGTAVASIIAASNDNIFGVDGIAKKALIMPIRVVPEGDETDKNVANAIIYAVDNGANIINMSFGKYYSLNADKVFEALEYAQKNNVMIVQSAGNESKDLDHETYYPMKNFKGKILDNFLRIGSHNDFVDEQFISRFTNFGKLEVDFLAPGEKIFTALSGNRYNFHSGTSLAAPVVSGVIASILNYFPHLSPKAVIEYLKKYSLNISPEKNFIVTGKGNSSLDQIVSHPGIINLANTLQGIYYSMEDNLVSNFSEISEIQDSSSSNL